MRALICPWQSVTVLSHTSGLMFLCAINMHNQIFNLWCFLHSPSFLLDSLFLFPDFSSSHHPQMVLPLFVCTIEVFGGSSLGSPAKLFRFSWRELGDSITCSLKNKLSLKDVGDVLISAKMVRLTLCLSARSIWQRCNTQGSDSLLSEAVQDGNRKWHGDSCCSSLAQEAVLLLPEHREQIRWLFAWRKHIISKLIFLNPPCFFSDRQPKCT